MLLKELRLENNLSQRDVANKIGCSYAVYNRYEKETRQPSLDVLISLATLYNVTIDYLIERDTPAAQKNHTDTKLNILTEQEQHLLDSFKQLSKFNQEIILGRTNDLLLTQREEEKHILKEVQ